MASSSACAPNNLSAGCRRRRHTLRRYSVGDVGARSESLVHEKTLETDAVAPVDDSVVGGDRFFGVLRFFALFVPVAPEHVGLSVDGTVGRRIDSLL